MKKTFFLKTFFLLWTLIFGVGSVNAEEVTEIDDLLAPGCSVWEE